MTRHFLTPTAACEVLVGFLANRTGQENRAGPSSSRYLSGTFQPVLIRTMLVGFMPAPL